MANNTNRRSLGVSLALHEAERVQRHAQACGLSTSAFLRQALMAHLATLPDPDADRPTPTKPEPTGSTTLGVDEITDAELLVLGMTRQQLQAIQFDQTRLDDVYGQVLWIRGRGPINAEFVPRVRYAGDLQYLDWLEHYAQTQGKTALLSRARRYREVIATLPEPLA